MNCLTSHSLSKELLSKPDGFITIELGDKEYPIENVKRKATHANIDDSSIYWSLCASKECGGNIKR